LLRLENFTKEGLLPPQDFELTINELRESILVEGPKDNSGDWDRDWRKYLVDNLEVIVKQLWEVGIKNIFVNGSFAENKNHPNDIDGYFECDKQELISGRLHRKLNLIDPHKVWTWDGSRRWFDPETGKMQLPMWHVYRVEMYPHFDVEQKSGIPNKYGHPLTFPLAFRQSRDFRQKGIVKILAK
jgi:hypothetical protein